MKKIKKKLIIILFLVLFLISFNTKADTVTCSKISDAVSEYQEIDAELSELDCSTTTDEDVVKTCNADNNKKALLLSKLYKYNDVKSDCNNKELDTIIEENKDNCSNVLGTRLKSIKDFLITAFYLIGPFLFIIFGSTDLFSIVTTSDLNREDFKQSSTPLYKNTKSPLGRAKRRFFYRLIALILLFLVPMFINILVSFSTYSLTGNVYSCKTGYTFFMNRWDVTYIPPVTNSSNTTRSGSTSNSSLGLGTNNGKFAIRTSAPDSSNSYYDYSASNLYQCVWYAQHRAIEALSTSNLSATEISDRVSKVSNSRGNGWVWYALSVPGTQTATRDSEDTATTDSLVSFQHSDDYTKPRAGSLVSWQWTDSRCLGYHNGQEKTCYGHVAFVEDVDEANNKILVSDGWNSNGSFGFRSEWYDIDYMQSFGGSYIFQGYVYLMD